MDNIHQTITQLRRSTPNHQLSDDFEDRVLGKIKRKKRQRRIVASTTLSLAFFGFLFVAGGIFINRPDPGVPLMAGAVGIASAVEEIPVTEEVVFAASDSQTDYAIEQVAMDQYDDETI